MAFLIDHTYKGIPIAGAHARIGEIRISSDKTKMKFDLEYRVSADQELIHTQEFETFYDIAAGDPRSQAYTYLRSLPEYTDATDC